MSQDPEMKKVYFEGKDLYARIAQSAFNNDYADNLEFYPEGTELEIDGKKVIAGKKTHKNPEGKSRRSVGKTLLLAANYGMGPKTAGEKMGKSAKEGGELLESFFKGFPVLKQTIEESKVFLKKNGYVEDAFGRRRHIPEINEKPYDARYADEKKVEELTFNPFLNCNNRTFTDDKLNKYITLAKNTRNNEDFDKLAREADRDGIILTANTGRIAQAERQCFNARIQGSAASLTKLAMVNIFNDALLKEYKADLIISVHDEVLVECPDYYADKVEERLPKIMIDTAKPYIDIPMSCDPYNVTRWYSDEMAAQLREELDKMEKGDPDKNIPPIAHDIAVQNIYKDHCEIPKEAIDKCLASNDDLEF